MTATFVFIIDFLLSSIKISVVLKLNIKITTSYDGNFFLSHWKGNFHNLNTFIKDRIYFFTLKMNEDRFYEICKQNYPIKVLTHATYEAK